MPDIICKLENHNSLFFTPKPGGAIGRIFAPMNSAFKYHNTISNPFASKIGHQKQILCS
jgi:hypothetical protein